MRAMGRRPNPGCSPCVSAAIIGSFLLAACGGTESESQVPSFDWPESVAAFGEGYPAAGDVCRRLGESAATASFLDHTTVLVGCPDMAAASTTPGEIIGEVDGIVLVSVPIDGPGAGATSADLLIEETPDPPDPVTGYNATAPIRCGFDNLPPDQTCDAGVKRRWGEERINLIEVTKPDGMKRAIYVRGLEPFAADSAQSDGSAGWSFETTRQGDQVTVRYGPETYIIFDAFVEGG